MTSECHRIRLLGPWHVRAVSDDEASNSDQRLNVRSAADWTASLDSTFNSQLVFARRFNWTFPEPPPSSVSLVWLDVNCKGSIHLNDLPLGLLSCATSLSISVLERLTVANNLQMTINTTQVDVSKPMLGDLFLEILD